MKTTDDNDLIRRVSLTLEGRSTLLFTFLFYGERQTYADPSRWNLDEYANDNDLKCQVTLILKGRIALQRTFRLHSPLLIFRNFSLNISLCQGSFCDVEGATGIDLGTAIFSEGMLLLAHSEFS